MKTCTAVQVYCFLFAQTALGKKFQRALSRKNFEQKKITKSAILTEKNRQILYINRSQSPPTVWYVTSFNYVFENEVIWTVTKQNKFKSLNSKSKSVVIA